MFMFYDNTCLNVYMFICFVVVMFVVVAFISRVWIYIQGSFLRCKFATVRELCDLLILLLLLLLLLLLFSTFQNAGIHVGGCAPSIRFNCSLYQC